MAKKKKTMGPELAIYDPDGKLVQRGLYDSSKAYKKAIELRGRRGEEFKYRAFTVRPYTVSVAE